MVAFILLSTHCSNNNQRSKWLRDALVTCCANAVRGRLRVRQWRGVVKPVSGDSSIRKSMIKADDLVASMAGSPRTLTYDHQFSH